MSTTSQELVVNELFADPEPFERVVPYDTDQGLYELDRRPETGYDVVLLYGKIGESAFLLTRIESQGKKLVDLPTSPENPTENMRHAFSGAPDHVIDHLFPSRTESAA